MQSRLIVDAQKESLLSTHKVLRNTYFLLGLTMAFSAVVAFISMSLNLPYPNIIVLLVGFYGLLFLTNKLADRPAGILAAFAFTGFMGYTIGPILNMYVARGMEDLIMLAFAGTAIVFFACSAYVLTMKKICHSYQAQCSHYLLCYCLVWWRVSSSKFLRYRSQLVHYLLCSQQ